MKLLTTRKERLSAKDRVLSLLADGPKASFQLFRAGGFKDCNAAYRACLRLELAGQVVREGRVAQGCRSSILWALGELSYSPEEEAAEAPQIIQGEGITDEDLAWHRYWLLPKAERRALPPPDFDPTFPRTGGIYDPSIPQPSHASRNAWRVSP